LSVSDRCPVYQQGGEYCCGISAPRGGAALAGSPLSRTDHAATESLGVLYRGKVEDFDRILYKDIRSIFKLGEQYYTTKERVKVAVLMHV
jgi:hypothetical protein